MAKRYYRTVRRKSLSMEPLPGVPGSASDFVTRVEADGGLVPDVSLAEFVLANKRSNTIEVLAPLGHKAGKLYGLLTDTYATVVRNSVGTYISGDTLNTAAINVPRFQNNKILVEPQSTNILLYSSGQDFDGFRGSRGSLTAVENVNGYIYDTICSCR